MSEIPFGYCHCGCEGKTEIATRTRPELGQIRGLPKPYILGHKHRIPIMDKFWKYVEIKGDDECWEWIGGRLPDGYGKTTVRGEDGISRFVVASRFIYEHTYGELPETLKVCHTCNNPPCVNIKHLYADTDKGNHDYAVACGRMTRLRGEEHGMARITEDDVRKIRAELLSGTRTSVLAKRYKMTTTNIISIGKRETWKHVV